ncbi:hypothetical protein ACFU93_32285 [Streptomyces sp. NPDC057611]|uniref:hypothetical protein n=1 Tax=Streptomyces sp. NPDC057611 TaxID=3346182 RepID=UPI0036B8DAD0
MLMVSHPDSAPESQLGHQGTTARRFVSCCGGALLGAGTGEDSPVRLLGLRPRQGHVETAAGLHLRLVHGLRLARRPASRLLLLGARGVPVQSPAAGQFGPLGFPCQLGLRRDLRGLAAALLLAQLGLAVV